MELESALEQCGRAEYQELDLTDPRTPPELGGWGSPTILIDGRDPLGQQPTGGCLSCRLYDTELHVPTTAMIVKALGPSR